MQRLDRFHSSAIKDHDNDKFWLVFLSEFRQPIHTRRGFRWQQLKPPPCLFPTSSHALLFYPT